MQRRLTEERLRPAAADNSAESQRRTAQRAVDAEREALRAHEAQVHPIPHGTFAAAAGYTAGILAGLSGVE